MLYNHKHRRHRRRHHARTHNYNQPPASQEPAFLLYHYHSPPLPEGRGLVGLVEVFNRCLDVADGLLYLFAPELKFINGAFVDIFEAFCCIDLNDFPVAQVFAFDGYDFVGEWCAVVLVEDIGEEVLEVPGLPVLFDYLPVRVFNCEVKDVHNFSLWGGFLLPRYYFIIKIDMSAIAIVRSILVAQSLLSCFNIS